MSIRNRKSNVALKIPAFLDGSSIIIEIPRGRTATIYDRHRRNFKVFHGPEVIKLENTEASANDEMLPA